MKTEKPLSEKRIDSYHGFMYSEKDVKEAVLDIIEEIETAQEDCATLDWIEKEHAVKIIKDRIGEL